MTDRNPQDQTQTPDEVSTPPELNTNQDTPTTELPSREYSRLMEELREEAEFVPRDKRFRRAFVVVASIWLLCVGCYAMPGFLGDEMPVIAALAVTVALCVGTIDWLVLQHRYRSEVSKVFTATRGLVVFVLLLCLGIMATVKHLSTDMAEYTERERADFVASARSTPEYEEAKAALLNAQKASLKLAANRNAIQTEFDLAKARLALLTERQRNEAVGISYRDADGNIIGSGVPNHANEAFNLKSNALLAQIRDQQVIVDGIDARLQSNDEATAVAQESASTSEDQLSTLDQSISDEADVVFANAGAVSKLQAYFDLLGDPTYAASAWLTTVVTVFVSIIADMTLFILVYGSGEAFRSGRERQQMVERLYQVQSLVEVESAVRNLNGASADKSVIRVRPLTPRAAGNTVSSRARISETEAGADSDSADTPQEETDERRGSVWADMNTSVQHKEGSSHV